MAASLIDTETKEIGIGNMSSTSVDRIEATVVVDVGPSCSALVRNENAKDGDQKGRGNDELENGGFQVGDFVWAKIKNHPWCPGQVYDRRDASEFAMKYSLADCLLVCFFGDGSCSWCFPSQLVHFVKNFKELSVDGTSRSFGNAVLSAVDEVSRLVESKMTCKCIPVEIRDGLARPVVWNAGVKEGVLAPKVDMDRLSLPDYKSDEILSELMHFARDVSIDNELEFAVLRSWLSAFYRAKGSYRLPMCCEHLHIEGMEDENANSNEVSNDFSSPIEVPILGSENDAPKLYHRRKRKSVAKLMEESAKTKPKSKKRATAEEGKDVGKSASMRRKKSNGDAGGEDLSTVVSESPEEMTRKELIGDIGDVNGAAVENTSVKLKEELEKISTPRERKKSKYLSPPYTIPAWWVGNSSSKTDIEYSNHRKKASEDLQVASPVSESDDEAFDEILPDDNPKGLGGSGIVNPMDMVDKKMSFDEFDVDIPVNELLLELESAAVDALYLSEQGTLDAVWAFASAFRSFAYSHGSDYNVFKKCKTGRKGNSLQSLGNQRDDIAQGNAESGLKIPKVVKTERKPYTSRSKNASEISIGENDAVEIDGNASLCLILTFSPEFPMPSKDEIVRLFGKFGVLNERETIVAVDSHSVQIVYMKHSDAETAFKSSVNQSPFGIENVVNYSLQYSLAGSQPEISPRKEAPLEKLGSSQLTANAFLSDVKVIKQKLHIMMAILENHHPKFSPEDESRLKDAMKDLLGNMETMREKVPVLAENSSS